MSAGDNLIGQGVCPVCNNHRARFTVSKKSLACMTCNACNTQIFARSDSSDEKLRGFIKAAPVAVAPVAASPVAAPAAPAPAPAPKTAPAAPAATTTKPGLGWGILGAFNA